MRHILWLSAVALLSSNLAFGNPRVAGPNEMKPIAITLTFLAGDTSDSDAIGAYGSCIARFSQAGGDDVSLYAVTTATTATSSGTLLASFTASTTTTPYEFSPGTLWVKAAATDATAGGSVLAINCTPVSGVRGVSNGPISVSSENDCTVPATFPCTFGG